MRKFGVQRRLVSRDELLKLSPPSRPMATRSPAAPTPAPTKAATPACSPKNWPAAALRGVRSSCYGHDVLRLNKIGDAIDSVAVIARNTGAGGQKDFILKGDAFGGLRSYSAPLLPVGVDLPIYPGKGLQRHLPAAA